MSKYNSIKDWIISNSLNSISGKKSDGSRINPRDYFTEDVKSKYFQSLDEQLASQSIDPKIAEAMKARYQKNFDAAQPFLNADANPNAKDMAGLFVRSAAEHPYKTLSIAGLGAGNLGGLFDNSKFGGQLGGLALGGLGSYMVGANPSTAALLTLGGGELGALFDKLRAKREQQYQQVPQQPQYYGR